MIICGCTVCEWYNNGVCAKYYGNTPACLVEPTLFDLDEVE